MSKRISRIDTIATLPVPIFLGEEILNIPELFAWLNVESLGVLDIAMSSRSAREQWLIVLTQIDRMQLTTAPTQC